MAGRISDINIFPVIPDDDSYSCLSNRETARENSFPDAFPGSGISSCWRKNISVRESVELANLLRALQKIAGHLGDNIGQIEYVGMSSQGDSVIRINPELVMGKYPVPPGLMDYVIGLVIHEALHQTHWSDHVWKLLEPDMQEMSPIQQVIFQRIVFAGEEIYIDRISDQRVFGLYTRISRQTDLAAQGKDIPSHRSTLDELILLWQRRQFPCNMESNVRPEYKILLSGLDHLADNLLQVSAMSVGITAKCRQRSLLYLDTWKRMKSLLQKFHVHKKQIYWFPCLQAVNNPSKKSRKNKPPKQMTPQLIREIQTNLAADTVDITPLIQSVVGFDNETVAPMSRWDFNIPSHPVIDKRMVSRLRAIFQNYAARKKVINRGLTSGRIDQRRLYRAPVTGRCFQEVDRIPSLDWSVSLLIDASGSMRGSRWKMVESTVANIHKALSGFHNRLNAYAYFEVNGISMISKLLKDNRLLSIPPAGQTASGQAIIAAGMLMPEKSRYKIMIHVTDGESNFGCDVSYGIDFCRQKNIHLVTLGCGYKTREAMEEQYHHTIQFIDHFEQLPRAVERLLKWTFLYGGRHRYQHHFPENNGLKRNTICPILN